MKLNIVAIIQARMAASRLPGKVLLEIAGQPMLVWTVERTRRAKTVDQVIVASTDHPADEAVANLCEVRHYPCYRGSQFDVLDRYYQSARLFEADIVVRITADCPFIDPDLIDHTVLCFLGNPALADVVSKSDLLEFPYDFAANRLPPPWHRTYPIGLDTEVCTFSALELAWHEASLIHQREHVMPFFYEQPERFRTLHVTHEPDFGHLRWTVDTPEDLEVIRAIAACFPGRDDFTWQEVLELVQNQPEITQINAQVRHKFYNETDSRTS